MSRNAVGTALPNELQAELNRKKTDLDIDKINTDHDRLLERQKESDFLKNFDLHKNRSEYINALANSSTDYLLKARDAGVFLNDSFASVVPFFPRNVILIGAETGVGKSTISANLAFNAMLQGHKVLIIVNEENPADVYNRITCLIKGWSYADHQKFTDEQIKVFAEMMPILAERIMVVGDDYGGGSGLTTTIEGIESLLRSLIKTKADFNHIIIDYYQNIDRSAQSSNTDINTVQYRFCKFIDQYKNASNATITILAQKKPSEEGKTSSFKDAIEGRKTIMNIATCAINVAKDVELSRTSFEIVKSRFSGSMGVKVFLGFDKGKYVDYSAEFKNQAIIRRDQKKQAELMAKVNPTNNNGG